MTWSLLHYCATVSMLCDISSYEIVGFFNEQTNMDCEEVHNFLLYSTVLNKWQISEDWSADSLIQQVFDSCWNFIWGVCRVGPRLPDFLRQSAKCCHLPQWYALSCCRVLAQRHSLFHIISVKGPSSEPRPIRRVVLRSCLDTEHRFTGLHGFLLG